MAPSLPSIDSAEAVASLFIDFVGTMDESDYQPLSICVVRPVAFPQRPWAPWAQGNGWLSRFSRMEFPHMLGVFDRAEPAPFG